MAAALYPPRFDEDSDRVQLLTSFRDALFGGSWGRLEYELRRLLQNEAPPTLARHECILEDLRLVEELRRKQGETALLRKRRSARRPVTV